MSDDSLIIAPEVIDLSTCDQEPIHIPGAIQPHGILFGFVSPRPWPVCVSANVESVVGLPAENALSAPLVEMMKETSVERLLRALGQDDVPTLNPIAIELRVGGGERRFDGILHRHEGMTFLELEPRPDRDESVGDFFRSVRNAIKRLQGAIDLRSACDIAAREVRRITGFDRVKVYRFASDWSGRVVAEDRVSAMPSLRDFHFPASDIPAQSRALYMLNPVRMIPDIGYRPAALVPDRNPVTGKPVDLTYAVLRSVSPIHVEYMMNMNVYGAMSVSIVRDGKLWGLISCHNKLPRFVPYEVRQACELIGQVIAWQIGVLEEAEIIRHSVRVKGLERRLLEEVEGTRSHHASLINNGEDLLALMNASGLAMCGSDGVTAFGHTPSEEQIQDLVRWLARGDDSELFETDRLSTLFAEAAEYAEVASGVLAVPLSRLPRSYMLWFRPEMAQTVTWGGNPHKPVRIGPHGDRLQTRASFDAWREEVRGQSRPWGNHEIVAAMEIRDLVIDVILRRTENLERVNVQLARSNEELESFAYVASHDLKEPLRHIEAFAGLLKELVPPDPAGRLSTMVSGIEASSRRLRALINDLAEYSRVGRQAQPFAPVKLEELIGDVTFDLKERVEESKAQIAIEALPVVLGDRNQLRQVFQNLLSNALKYHYRDRTPQIRVSAIVESAGGEHESATTAPWAKVRIEVEDNGIGFEEHYREQIFEPFQRLHGPDEYEGTGIGLAICRKIVQRHGGQIGARSILGQGSTFFFTLPLRSLQP